MSTAMNQPEELNFDTDVHRHTACGQVLPSVSHITEPLSREHYKEIPRGVPNDAACEAAVKSPYKSIRETDRFPAYRSRKQSPSA